MIRSPFQINRAVKSSQVPHLEDTIRQLSRIQKVVDDVEEMGAKLREKHETLLKDTSLTHARRMKEMDGAVSELKKKVADVFVMKEGPRGIQGLQGEKGERGQDGLNGEDGVDGVDGKDGKDGVHADPEKVVDLIKEKKLLKTEHIDGLEEHIATIRRAAALANSPRGGEGEWKVKNLTGTINSSNKVFTCSAGGPPNPNSHHVMLNYQEQNPLADYSLTYSNGTITVTYTTAPDSSLSGLPHYIRFL